MEDPGSFSSCPRNRPQNASVSMNFQHLHLVWQMTSGPFLSFLLLWSSPARSNQMEVSPPPPPPGNLSSCPGRAVWCWRSLSYPHYHPSAGKLGVYKMVSLSPHIVKSPHASLSELCKAGLAPSKTWIQASSLAPQSCSSAAPPKWRKCLSSFALMKISHEGSNVPALCSAHNKY